MSTIASLDTTVAAQWRRELIGYGPSERSHWRTKTAHYQAVADLLAEDPHRTLRWSSVVEAVRPRGSRSTFYDVTGPKAAHSLIARYAAVRNPDCLQIAYRYQRDSAVDQLIDEMKVWSFWSYREAWLAVCRAKPTIDEAFAAASLAATLTAWASACPAQAAALAYSPPVCAVEDLVLIRQGALPALRAFTTLAAVVAKGVTRPHSTDQSADPEPPPVGPNGGVEIDLSEQPEEENETTDGDAQVVIPKPRRPAAEELLLGLAEKIAAIDHGLPTLPPRDAAMVRIGAAELMRDAVAALA